MGVTRIPTDIGYLVGVDGKFCSDCIVSICDLNTYLVNFL